MRRTSADVLVDLLKKTMEKCGLQYELIAYPIRRIHNNLATGKVDLFLGPKIPEEFQGQINSSAEVIRNVIIRLYSIKGESVPNDINGLKGKRVIVIHGYNYGGFLKKLEDPQYRIVVDPSPSHLSGFLKLLNRRGDYFLDYREPCIETLKKHPLDNIDYTDFITIPIYLHTSKMTPDSENLLKKISKVASEIEGSN
jgi:polar amino acid transport system substrate-binding protein